jgi:hypothetical protein
MKLVLLESIRCQGRIQSGDAPAVWPASWGQGRWGAAGYDDHGESELNVARVTPEKCRELMRRTRYSARLETRLSRQN